MIGPGDLLLESSPLTYLLSLLLQFFWVGLQKSKQLNLDVKNIFVESPTNTVGDALSKGKNTLGNVPAFQ